MYIKSFKLPMEDTGGLKLFMIYQKCVGKYSVLTGVY